MPHRPRGYPEQQPQLYVYLLQDKLSPLCHEQETFKARMSSWISDWSSFHKACIWSFISITMQTTAENHILTLLMSHITSCQRMQVDGQKSVTCGYYPATRPTWGAQQMISCRAATTHLREANLCVRILPYISSQDHVETLPLSNHTQVKINKFGGTWVATKASLPLFVSLSP